MRSITTAFYANRFLNIERWFAPIELKNAGIREIPPSPTRPPEIADIEITAVESMIRVLGDRREAKRDLLAFRALERKRRFQVAAALVFRGEDPADVQVAFAIDDVLSPPHEEAFARSRYKRKLIGGDTVVNAEAVVEGVLGKALVDTARQARQPPETSQPIASGQLPERAVEVRPPELGPGHEPHDVVRMLETYEHPAFLDEALASADDRLLIVSPWVRRSIVDKKFMHQLEERLAAGVDVFIGWGITSLTEKDVDIDANVVAEFEELRDRFKFNFFCRRLGNTHAKVLVCDQRFLIVTSFNWLSFKGDPRRTFRDERGTFVAISNKIDEQFAAWSARIKGGKANRR